MKNFIITYRITVQEGEEIDEKIERICLEQTAELPRDVLPASIQENVVGTPASIKKWGKNKYKVGIEWPLAVVGDEISQLLNVLYGNISLQPGIQILSAEWSALAGKVFEGPGFGISGIRGKYKIKDRPLSATALKPLGSTPSELAELAFQFASGGIDLIKDDHGLANQEFAPFAKRVEASVSACNRARDRTGRCSYYYPNVTAFGADSVTRYKQAAEMGANGALLCPHIAGLETMHRLARLSVDLPIIAHPAFSGRLSTQPSRGLAPGFLYGQLWRALGADFVIYPNQGGRFSFTATDCRAINDGARDLESPFKSSFPMPAGGIKIKNVEQWISEYGKDNAFLIGGSLYEHPDGVQAAAKEFSAKLKL